MSDKVSDKVLEVLEKFKIKRPPVPVDRIAKKLGILLAPLPGDDEISGAIVRKDGHVVIAVNPAHHINRQRFTIAHELGHYFFHVDLRQHVDQDFQIAWRNADSSKAVNWTEIEANQFAAHLLMPTDFLEDDLNELQVIDKRAVLLLAEKYLVSRQAMTIRLSQLGITGPY
jgi:Zn-dependent peptidase ImmA (M78 family)